MNTPGSLSAQAASLVQGPAAPLVRPGVRTGFRAIFRGYGYLFRTPDLWLPALVPIGVALLLAVVLGTVTVQYAPLLVTAVIGTPNGTLWTVVTIVLKVLVTIAIVALAVALSFALAKPLASPALERLLRRTEADLGAPAWPKTSFFEDILRSLQSTLVSLTFSLPILVGLTALGLFIPPAAVITIPLQFVLTGLLTAWDICDYPLSIRGTPVLERIDFMRRNLRCVLGFGIGLALLSLLPCALVLVLPAGVIGAAHLVVEIERWEGRIQSRVGT
jgi:CysZ protein